MPIVTSITTGRDTMTHTSDDLPNEIPLPMVSTGMLTQRIIRSPRVDRNGMLWETVVDIFGAGLSFYEFVKAPGWGSGAIFVYDLGAVFIPFVPGSVTGRIVAKVATDVAPDVLKAAFKNVKKFNLGNYRDNLKRLTHGRIGPDIMKGWDAHHIIPKTVHDRLEKMGSGINPNEPQFLTWWKTRSRWDASRLLEGN